MNRSLWIPAGCCLLGFVALLAILQGATSREANAETTRLRETLNDDRAPMLSTSDSLLSRADAERALTTLSGEYLRPWRQRENSPHRLYSRAAVRPIPSISAEVAMSTDADESDQLLLATITVRTGAKSQPIPCVVDRVTQRASLFHDGRWVSEKEWLTNTPLPSGR